MAKENVPDESQDVSKLRPFLADGVTAVIKWVSGLDEKLVLTAPNGSSIAVVGTWCNDGTGGIYILDPSEEQQ